MLTVPRRILLTLRLGEMPAHIPSWISCTRYGTPMPDSIDGGAIDRILRHFGGAARMARVHSARLSRDSRPDITGARRFDDVEQLCGVARVLRIEVRDGNRLGDLLQALCQLPCVESASPERIVFGGMDSSHPQPQATFDPEAAWEPREKIRLPQALAYETGDSSILVGLADTGVMFQHPGLGSALRPGFDTVDLAAGEMPSLELVGDDAAPDLDPSDEVGHGTGCAGIMASSGEDLPPGAAGRCLLVPARVLGAALKTVSGRGRRVGVGSVANIDAGMKRLVDLGVKVINMSFGTPSSQIGENDPMPHQEVVKYALARGVVLVAASGNSGLTETYYPAALHGVIAVGAVDAKNEPASFSTRGDHIALCAPGCGIWTCGLNGWQRASGTSFAAPFVSAVCALMLSRASARACPVDASTLRDLLCSSSRPFASAGVTGLGRGVLDAYGALYALDQWIDDNDDLALRTSEEN